MAIEKHLNLLPVSNGLFNIPRLGLDDDVNNILKTNIRDHQLRVSKLSAILAIEAGYTQKRVEEIRYAATIHDIGKLSMQEQTETNESFDNYQQRTIQMHTVIGAQMLLSILINQSMQKIAYDVILHHHQRWDGSGYPNLVSNGKMVYPLSTDPSFYEIFSPVKGKLIPTEALLVGMADRYDALRSKRPYKPELSHLEAYDTMNLDNCTNKTGEQYYGPELWHLFTRKHKILEVAYIEINKKLKNRS
ncbi:HD domain-containing protein [Candidatus Woesearchaeota archaeon]|nr:HD domain-containing protein [Candidatus Woesearchaeota archaeon]